MSPRTSAGRHAVLVRVANRDPPVTCGSPQGWTGATLHNGYRTVPTRRAPATLWSPGERDGRHAGAGRVELRSAANEAAGIWRETHDHARERSALDGPGRRPRVWRWCSPAAVPARPAAAASGDAEGSDLTIDCAPYEEFGDLKGETVSVYTSIVDPEDQPHIDSYKPFEECTGVEVKYEGSREFEAQLVVRVQSGNAPDIAFIPQPGLLATLVGTGAVVARPEAGRGERRRVLGRELEGLRHRRRHLLRRPAGRQRQVLRLVLAVGVRGRRLRGPDDLGRDDRRCPTRSPRAAPSRGAPASAPVTPPAGRPPTGWRTSSCGPPVPRSTTSGSRTRSPSTTRRSSRRSTPSARS